MKLEKLRTLLSELEIDGLVITSSFNLQYMTRLYWLSRSRRCFKGPGSFYHGFPLYRASEGPSKRLRHY